MARKKKKVNTRISETRISCSTEFCDSHAAFQFPSFQLFQVLVVVVFAVVNVKVADSPCKLSSCVMHFSCI